MKSVSANVMTGQYGNYGTNSFQLLLDTKIFEKIDLDKNSNENTNENIDIAKKLINNPYFYKDMNIVNNIANFKETTNSYVCDDEYDAGF